ncbi:hypothetical protein R1sor_003792 [Riccia sorocarpa]|uniref:Uncharacterized protein n=1 Tax=Riccia sorocarpa TaxID=122646 RepID=A0ABD3H2M8_9MARC
MAAAAKLGLGEFSSGIFQHHGSSSPSKCGREWNRLPYIKSERHERRLPVSCSFKHRPLKPRERRTHKLQHLKQSALPLDKSSIEKDAEEVESEKEEPWLGATIFKRSAIQTHYELQTSLERLGLTVLSSSESSSLAKTIGIIPKKVEFATEEFTPVGISIDVTRQGRDLRLDGLVRTAISLCCNRCLSPVVKRVLVDFSLLLTEKPVMEPTQPRLGVVLGDSSYQSPDEVGDALDIDLDDKLHFPLNLNKNTCKCVDVKVKPSWGPLEQLKRQLEEEQSREAGNEDDGVDG